MYRPIHHRLARFGLCLAVLLGLLVAGCGQQGAHHSVGAGPVPPASIFGVHNTWFVSSSYADESNLLDGSQPVQDDDYGFPYGASYPVHLPGHSWDRFAYYGSLYIYGSGFVDKFATPNGGRFAFLHMRSGLGGQPYTIPSYCGASLAAPGHDATGLAAAGLIPLPGAAVWRYVAGGSYVALSGWPFCPQYANGSPGEQNAHLCLLLDQKALDWFLWEAGGHDRPPVKPFAWKAWHVYTARHGTHSIHAKLHRHWTREAWVWWRWHGIRKACAAPARHERWYAKGAYTAMRFESCTLYTWPHAKGDPIKVQRAKVIR